MTHSRRFRPRGRVGGKPVRALAVLVVTALVVSTAFGTAYGTAEGRSEKLQRALDHLVTMTSGPPGAVAVVHRGEHRQVYVAGDANVKSGREIRVNDHMRVASVAKAFSGAVALSLVKKDKLSLNDTIGELLPFLPQAWWAVTLRQLLHHTSGIPDFSKNKKFNERVNAEPGVPLPPRQLLAFVAHKPLKFTPGSKYKYSNSDNVAVGLMVQEVTDKRYARVMVRQVNQPLGLAETSLPTGPRLPKPFIHGYQLEVGSPPEDVSQVLAAGLSFSSGGVVSTPADLDRFIRGYVARRLFGEGLQDKQLRLRDGHSEPPGPGENDAGLAIFRYKTRCGTMFGHTGNTPGYTQFAASTLNGKRSATVSVSTQLNPELDKTAFKPLRHAFLLAACAALKD